MNQHAGKSPEGTTNASPASASGAHSGEASTLDALSRQLLSWSHLWSGYADGDEAGNERHIVRERLASWLERCIGRRARSLLANHAEDLSLATSTPMLVAFLGRRATRELSRHVLKGL